MENLFLSSYEYSDFWIPRKIISYRKIQIENKNGLIVKVEDPLIGNKYGITKDVDELCLLPRFSLFALKTLEVFPIEVFVLIKKSDTIQNLDSLNNLQNIAWASLYNNYKRAKNHKL